MYDTKQNELINELDRNIILLASAGTGKTSTLAERIVKIIDEKRCNSKEILCITFTNRACKEMRDRIYDVVGEAANDITIKTCHSFCFDIIKSEAKQNTDIFVDFIIFDEDDTKEIIKKCEYGDFKIILLQSFINLVKEERIRLGYYSEDEELDYKQTVEYLYKYKKEKIKEVCEINFKPYVKLINRLKIDGYKLVKKYNNILHNNHGLDFVDLLDKANEILNKNNVAYKIQQKYKYINIDEVQDISDIEYNILKKIFGNNNILLCGDIFQTIYEWRNAEPKKIINDFIKKYNPKKIVYNNNYRATKKLTQASINYLDNMYPNLVNKLYKNKIKAKSRILGENIEEYESNYSLKESEYIYNIIKKLEQNNELGNACILTRRNKCNFNISEDMEQYIKKDDTFEFILSDQYKFFRKKEVKDILAFMRLICNKNDSISLSRILNILFKEVKEDVLKEIDSQEYRKVGILLSDYIDSNVEIYGDKFGKLIDALNLNNIIVFDVETTGLDVTEDEIVQIVGKRIDYDGNTIENFEEFIIPNKSIKESSKIHGFSQEFLEKYGKDKKTVLKNFIKFIEGKVLVGHNISFDINILLSEISREKLEKPKIDDFFDTLDIYRRFYPNLKNHKLETLSKEFDIINLPNHNSINDVLATKELLIYVINKNIIPTALKRKKYMKKYLNYFKEIRILLNKVFLETSLMRPYEIFEYIFYNFKFEELYKLLYDNKEYKIVYNTLKNFYSFLIEIDKYKENSKDALIDLLQITALSNGELEQLVINTSSKKKIPIITVHQAKGLEFDTVFLAMTQDSNFPAIQATKKGNIEEEKRIFYVAITRAKRRLYISYKGYRSRFIDYIYYKNKKPFIFGNDFENKREKYKYDNMSIVELGNTGEKEAIPFIKRYLLSSSQNDKRLAASAINKLCIKYEKECRQYKSILLKNLEIGGPQVREYTLKALSNMILNFEDLEYLVSIYKKEDKDYNRNLIENIIYSSKIEK